MIITGKRVSGLFFVFAFIASALIFRIASVQQSQYSDAAENQSARVLTLGETRGMIYDRNTAPLVNKTSHTAIAVNPTAKTSEYLKNCLSAEDYEKILPSLNAGKPFTAVCDSYSGECDGIISSVVYDRYSPDDNAAHIIGYLDSDGRGVSGIEKSFDALLSGASGSLSVRYYASSNGAALGGKGFETVNDNYDSREGVVLTLDSRIQRICESVMERDNLEKGAVVVLKADTSEILALASSPSFDRNDLSASLESGDSPFLNRALGAYAVGSVFKPVVAAAALEQGISRDAVFDCPGFVDIGSNRFNCHKQSGHGENDMTAAMAASCNAYFIKLGSQVGAESIISKASLFGFGKEITLCDGIASASGTLPSSDDIDSAPALANLSFGQGELLASPLQIAAVYCAFANGGYYREPYILKEIVDKNGNATAYYKNEINNKVLTDKACSEIVSMLKETVESGSGMLAKPMGFGAAGKTATAETGLLDENGEKTVHTWFAGFFPADEPEYVIVVFKEDGNASSTDCAPVFRDIADAI